MRIGAAMKDGLPLISATKAEGAKILDRKEGWIGDSGRDAAPRELQIGGTEAVRQTVSYQCMARQHDVGSASEDV